MTAEIIKDPMDIKFDIQYSHEPFKNQNIDTIIYFFRDYVIKIASEVILVESGWEGSNLSEYINPDETDKHSDDYLFECLQEIHPHFSREQSDLIYKIWTFLSGY